MKKNNENIEKMITKDFQNITPSNYKNINLNSVRPIPKKTKIVVPNLARKISFASLIIIFAVLLLTGGTAFATTGYETVAIELNPSVELTINRLGNVTDVNYLNADGEELFSNVNLKHQKIDECLLTFVDLAYEKGYLNSQDDVIYISGYDKNKNFNTEKLDKYTQLIQTYCKQKGYGTQVKGYVVDKEEKNQADEKGIGYAKTKKINQKISKDASYNFDDLSSKSLKELREILKSLETNNNSSGHGHNG